MTHVTASVKIHLHAMLHTIMIKIHVSVPVDLMTAILVSILTTRAVAVSAQNTSLALTINTSTVQLASVNAAM